jgi:TusA-related sulfurtransferase
MAQSGIRVDRELDCRGLSCPIPVVKTKQAIAELAVGQVLRMVATDPGSIPDMQAWSNRTGHKLLEAVKDGGLFFFLIQKTK